MKVSSLMAPVFAAYAAPRGAEALAVGQPSPCKTTRRVEVAGSLASRAQAGTDREVDYGRHQRRLSTEAPPPLAARRLRVPADFRTSRGGRAVVALDGKVAAALGATVATVSDVTVA
eukprot:CAMPEP_0181188200 /NCGR_PEP_ID=MMETSP1096-20121128/10983_1 /TAXON_ID=156174 ORGANISM="Chrysochromulina ericina, Strain CCMP281" /NCGR_SAMPLE_ID=MMETSP1096 /ASSEMBLY_ACC=CAM_ASM_000453 /LENGTH=116 /DNA_ID=CAMNT_0023277233 /DNA_START=903 /DNA_END=1251 /DNA_ORIENTATION=+